MSSTKEMQKRAASRRKEENKYRQYVSAFKKGIADWGMDEKSTPVQQAAERLGIKLQ
jgi:hypothetical protein